MKRKIGILSVVLVLTVTNLFAWGPMTHLTVNTRAIQDASREMRENLCIPADLQAAFIGGGPSPDIKMQAGATFPADFHNSLEAIVRMIRLAKTDSRYGLLDVVEALGWAGHLFAEVTTAHAAGGYPNNKITVSVPGAEAINHQLNELCVDLLNFRDHQETLRTNALTMPIRLLEASMKAEQASAPSAKAMTAVEIKTAATNFLPTVLGVKTMAEYLRRQRPDLLEEMDAFYGDRHTALNDSVGEVVTLLKTHARKDFHKSSTGSADGQEKVRVPLTGELKDKVKTFVYRALGATLKGGPTNDIFTHVAYGVMNGLLNTGLTRARFLSFALQMGRENTWGGEVKQKIVGRFVEGLVAREDLTFPEIIAWAQEDIARDQANVAKQKTQFDLLRLTPDGRKPVSATEVSAAQAEVERLEGLRREWPWFWPLRPTSLQLARAREKAGRLLAYHFYDAGTSTPALLQKAQSLLQKDRTLRRDLFAWQQASWFNPVAKWNSLKTAEKTADALVKDQRFLANVMSIRRALGGTDLDAEKLGRLTSQTQRRLAESETALQRAKEARDRLPIWNLVKRNQAKDEIHRLEATVQSLREYLDALGALAGTLSLSVADGGDQAAAASTGSAGQASTAKAPSLSRQREFEAAYRRYVDLIGRTSADDPTVKKALGELQRLQGASPR